MSKGVGSGGISTEGLFFSVDAFNLKSYIPPIGTPTTSNATGSSYTGFTLSRVSDSTQQPVVFGIAGDVQSAWMGYINGGTIALLLGGGSIPETYNINNALYVSSTNTTALYPDFTANFVTMSHTHSMGNWYGGGTRFIKMSGDFGIFNIYLSDTSPLVFSLTGGGGPVIGATTSGASYSGLALNRVYDNTQQPIVIGVSGDQSALYNGYISGNGGTLSMSLSGGSIPEIFEVTTALYNSYNNTTILYRAPSSYVNSVTMSGTCSMDNTYGPFLINISGNSESFINMYFNGGGNPLMFDLTGGATAESFTVSTAFFDGTNTIIYDSGFLGTLYSDHTQYQVLVPEMVGTLYTDNTTFTFSYPYSPETYSVNSVYYDGVDTYLYDSGYIGALYSDHTQFRVLVPEMIGTLYTDHTNATYSYVIITPQIDCYDLSSRSHNTTLYNGVGFDGRSFIFDGVDDYIDVGVLGSSFSSFSMDLWFNSGSIVDYKNILDFNGGNTMLRIEQYSAPGFYHTWTNLGGSSGRCRMSINVNGLGDAGFGIGGDCPLSILQNEWYNLIVSYQGGGGVVPLTDAWGYDGFIMQRVADSAYIWNIMMIQDSSPNTTSLWNNWISVSGGTLSTTVYQSSGTYSETYIVSNAIHSTGSATFLIPAADPSIGETMSGIGFIDDVFFPFNTIRFGSTNSGIYRWDKIYDELFLAWSSLTMSLVSGTYSQTYVVDSVAYSEPFTYIYDSANIGASGMTAGTYSSFTVLMPKFGVDDLHTSTYSGPYDRIYGSTISGNICSMYLNGEKFINQWIIPNGFVGYINNMRIGDGYDYSTRRFQGKIPITSIYDRSITDEEAYTNYEELKWRFI